MSTHRINYIKQINAFNTMCSNGALPGITGNNRSVYLALLDINNSARWSDTFDVDFDQVLKISCVDKDTYRRSMDALNGFGLFDSYIKGKNKHIRARVSLKILCDEATTQLVAADPEPIPTMPQALALIQQLPEWSNSIKHHIMSILQITDLSKAEKYLNGRFEVFWDQKINNWRRDGLPAWSDIANHFYSWVPVHLKKQINNKQNQAAAGSVSNYSTNGLTRSHGRNVTLSAANSGYGEL